MKRILIIDDDKVFLQLTSRFLQKHGYATDTFESWAEARAMLLNTKFDMVLVDLHFPGISGIQIIEEIKTYYPLIPILMITAHSSILTAIESVKAGADDYIQKPCENNEILFKINKTLENAENKVELKNLKETLGRQFNFNTLVTKDEDTKKTYHLAKTAADLDVLIFITGETGTGKDVLAKTIHMSSFRSSKPFVVFNCAAINENLVESELFGHKKGSFTSAYSDRKGLCESVEDGTLFIDEIGELPLGVQKKLLRLLQEKEFEVLGGAGVKKFNGRLIAASHRDLKKMVKDGNFREDLFYRLNVYPLYLKPLRERLVDLMDLVGVFIKQYSDKYNKVIDTITPRTCKSMMEYKWPGNVRELEHFIERQILITKKNEIDIKDMSAFEGLDMTENKEGEYYLSKPVGDFNDFMKNKEKEYLSGLLKEARGSVDKASAIAKIHRKTLYMKLKEHGLDRNDYK